MLSMLLEEGRTQGNKRECTDAVFLSFFVGKSKGVEV